jgi:hypothetical protein
MTKTRIPSCYVNSQKNNEWNNENPYTSYEKHSHLHKLDCCVFSRPRVIGPTFVKKTVYGNLFRDLVHPFIVLLDKEHYCWFQQHLVLILEVDKTKFSSNATPFVDVR